MYLKKFSWRQRPNMRWASRAGSGSVRVVTIGVW